MAYGKKPKPPLFFEYLSEAEARTKEFVLQHLDCFGIKMLKNELMTEIIPALMMQSNEDGVDADSLEQKLSINYMANTPSYTTVLSWFHFLDFNHSTRHKSYYIDGHEHPAQELH